MLPNKVTRSFDDSIQNDPTENSPQNQCPYCGGGGLSPHLSTTQGPHVFVTYQCKPVTGHCRCLVGITRVDPTTDHLLWPPKNGHCLKHLPVLLATFLCT